LNTIALFTVNEIKFVYVYKNSLTNRSASLLKSRPT
jgi:hypothetical protein